MRKHFFNRFLVIALILVFSCSLSVPAFAAEELTYQYTFSQEFDFSQFSFVAGSWYEVDLGSSFNPVPASGDYVNFFLDDHKFNSSFKTASFNGSPMHYIGNANIFLGSSENTGEPYCFVISPDDFSLSKLYLQREFFNSLFQGDKTKVHVAISVARFDFEPDTFLDKFFSLFNDIGQWLRTQIDLIVSLFWNAKAVQLTFFGVLSLLSLGISVVLLLIKVILNFLHFRS